jgi:carbamoyl-phosphate synthase small subunit
MGFYSTRNGHLRKEALGGQSLDAIRSGNLIAPSIGAWCDIQVSFTFMSISSTQSPAILALEDGRVFHGVSIGASGNAVGEICFNTSMSGYQEVLTDPSYRGQIVTMTYPLIGNYGTGEEDGESSHPQVNGFVIEELSRVESNWRASEELQDYLRRHGIPAISGIDTRSLTRHLRTQGAMRACLSTDGSGSQEAVQRAKGSPGLEQLDLVGEVSTREIYEWDPECKESIQFGMTRHQIAGIEPLVVLYDFGVKRNILRLLRSHGVRVMVVPSTTSAEEALALNPQGIFLSNGPGDPAVLTQAHETARQLAEVRPVFGICLGHQILSLAFGASTFKLKFGHRGANQPVQDLRSGRVLITSQNHGYAVKEEGLPDDLEVTHRHLNDGTVAGIRHRGKNVRAVQFHPEASPGPHDSSGFFEEFVDAIRG